MHRRGAKGERDVSTDLEPLLTEADLMARWGCSMRTLDRYRAQGLVAVKVNGVKFRPSDVAEFEERRATGQQRLKPKRRKVAMEPETDRLWRGRR
jgi:hypothetical protein